MDVLGLELGLEGGKGRVRQVKKDIVLSVEGAQVKGQKAQEQSWPHVGIHMQTRACGRQWEVSAVKGETAGL